MGACSAAGFRVLMRKEMQRMIREKENILATIAKSVTQARSDTEVYISKFNGDGILKLFDDKSDKKKYLERYNEFTAKIAEPLSNFEASVAALSRLLLLADQSCNVEETIRLSSLFECCETFLAAVHSFLEVNGKNFSEDESFKASVSLGSARTLKSAIDSFASSRELNVTER